jgi:hypothetical protein
MTIAEIILVALLVAALAALGVTQLRARARRARRESTPPTRRILFPFVGGGLSQSALDAALRLATAENATLVPVFLARVPLQLPLDAPLPKQCGSAIPLLEAIEQRAQAFGVPVDARIAQGRTERHALRQTIGQERFDRIVVAAAVDGTPGFDAEDVAWLLENAPGEIVVLRPDTDERIQPPARRKPGGPSARLGSIVNMKRKRRHDDVRPRLEGGLEESPALVMKDLVPALVGDDQRDQDGDRGVLVLDRLDVAKHGANQ